MADKKPTRLEANTHRRVLEFLNGARRPEDLMTAPPSETLVVDPRLMDDLEHADEHPPDQHHGGRPPRVKPIMDRDVAKRILRAREDYSPLHGFRHVGQLENVAGFDRKILERLVLLFSPRFRGKWEVLYDAD